MKKESQVTAPSLCFSVSIVASPPVWRSLTCLTFPSPSPSSFYLLPVLKCLLSPFTSHCTTLSLSLPLFYFSPPSLPLPSPFFSSSPSSSITFGTTEHRVDTPSLHNSQGTSRDSTVGRGDEDTDTHAGSHKKTKVFSSLSLPHVLTFGLFDTPLVLRSINLMSSKYSVNFDHVRPFISNRNFATCLGMTKMDISVSRKHCLHENEDTYGRKEQSNCQR